ncbi:MAG: hypothetical protein ACREBV_10080, partial [Candidatus Zixiibacteriota bacterium]
MFKLLLNSAIILAISVIAFPFSSKGDEPKTVDELIEELYPNGFPVDNLISYPYGILIRPESKKGIPGPTKLILTMTNNWCQSMTFQISRIEKLEYQGQMFWTFDGIPGDTLKIQLDIVV